MTTYLKKDVPSKLIICVVTPMLLIPLIYENLYGWLPRAHATSDVLILENFEDEPLGESLRDWKSRRFGGKKGNRLSRGPQVTDGTHPYQVVQEEGNHFLRVEDRGENVMFYKEIRWDTRTYPYISWRWRIRAVPVAADARFEDSADSAAGVYLTYRRKFGLVPETVKFIWSEHLNIGSAFRRSGIGMPWTVVAGVGAANQSVWHQVVFHVGDVYDQTFGGVGATRPLGVAVLSDANNTNSFAAADYDDIVALREPPSGVTVSTVTKVLSLEN